MSYSRGEHPNSLANLEGNEFRPGYDERRSHRPNGGMVFLEHFNEYTAGVDPNGEWRHDRAELERIKAGDDDKATPAQVLAAKAALHWLDADGFDKLDRMPKWASFLQHALDRCVGKPVQQIEVDGHVTHERIQDWDGVVRMLAGSDRIMRAQLRAALEAAEADQATVEISVPGDP